MSLLLAGLLLSGGCVDPPTDAEAYLAAAADPLDAGACAAIGDPRLRGECLAMVAAEIAQATGELDVAASRCAQIPAEEAWRGECYFLVVDAVELIGEDARRLCQEAGQYRDRCLGHALQREGRPLLLAAPRGEERAAFRALLERATFYFGDDEAVAGQKVWHLVAEFVASRDRGQPFTAATCGEIPWRLCRTGYLTRARYHFRDTGASTEQLAAACAALPVSPEEAERYGLPPWTEDVDVPVQAALEKLCGRAPPPSTPRQRQRGDRAP